MRGPGPPIMELGFYYEHKDDVTAFREVVHAALSRGAELLGPIRLVRGEGIRARPLGRWALSCFERLTIKDPDELERWFEDPDTYVIAVDVKGEVGPNPRAKREIIEYSLVSKRATGRSNNPVSILCDADIFDDDRVSKAQRKTAGRKVRRAFYDCIEATSPSYAAITVEYSMASPTDLKLDLGTYAFGSFYVSRAFLGDTDYQEVLELFEGETQHVVHDGVHIYQTGVMRHDTPQADRLVKMIASRGG